MKTGVVNLGNTLTFGAKKTKVWGRLSDRVQVRLEGWKSQLLSRVMKATLIHGIAQAIHVCSMSTFMVPKSVCGRMDNLA